MFQQASPASTCRSCQTLQQLARPAPSPTSAFGPVERAMAAAGLLLMVIALVAGMLRGFGARVALDAGSSADG